MNRVVSVRAVLLEIEAEERELADLAGFKDGPPEGPHWIRAEALGNGRRSRGRVMEDLMIEATLQQVTADEARKCRKEAMACVKDHGRAQLKLASVLFRVRYGVEDVAPYRSLWVVWGHLDFNEYVERELGLSLATAQQYIHVWFTFQIVLKALVPLKTLEQLGIAKLRRLVGVVNETNVVELCERAKKQTCKELEARKRVTPPGTDEDPSGELLQTMNFNVNDEERGVLERGLARLAVEYPNRRRGTRLMLALLAWEREHRPAAPLPTPVRKKRTTKTTTKTT